MAYYQAIILDFLEEEEGFVYPQLQIGNVWKTITEMKLQIGNAWKDITELKIQIGNAWKDLVSS